MPGYIRCLAVLSVGLLGALLGNANPLRGAEQTPVTAIDILLEPDSTMLRYAEANNARLLKAYPHGFALDAAHRPHITMIQRFVRTADLENVYAAAGKVLVGANVNAMGLEAFRYYSRPRHRIRAWRESL